MIKVPYYDQLVQIRQFLEENLPDFPQFKCYPTTRLVESVVGLKGVGGYCMNLNYNNGSHFWNHDLERKLFVDLSLDQFEGIETSISILPDSTEILKTGFGFIEEYKKILVEDRYIEARKEAERICKLYEERYGESCPIIGTKSSM